MAVAVWKPGTLYQPGAVVRPVSSSGVVDNAIANPSFEDGDTGWTKGAGWVIDQGTAFDGAWRARFSAAAGTQGSIECDSQIATSPGQTCSFDCYLRSTTDERDTFAQLHIRFFDDLNNVLSTVAGDFFRADKPDQAWVKKSASAVAPANAAYFKVLVDAVIQAESDPCEIWADLFILTSVHQAPVAGLVFTAVQAEAGFSGSSEPDWPDTLGLQVVDNDVTWEALTGDRITWRANPILVSGAVEPTWPVDGSVPDNTISWERDAQRVSDADDKVPHSKVVALAASKIFVADEDLVAFCGTVNPLDWSSENDAGYMPFGLQTYGAQPAAAMGLYRGNLVVFNAAGFQMWQVDEDPQNMAILDAVPVGSEFHRSIQPVVNDLVFLTKQGVRSVGIAGASTNLQAGDFGKQIDPLVIPKIKTVVAGTPSESDSAAITVGGSGGNWGYSDLPFANKGSVAPVGFAVNGALLRQFQSSTTSNQMQLALSGNLAQDHFISITYEYAPGLFETVNAADASLFTYSGTNDVTLWQWTTANRWDSSDSAQVYGVTFTITEAVPGVDPLGLYIPGLGQYWLIFEDEAFVLTINGNDSKSRSWSRYTFPAAIDDWTIMDGDLYLRAGDLVWRVDEDAVYDDEDEGDGAGGTNTDFEGYIAWPYLDLGGIGRDKMLAGFDLVVTGEVNVQFGYDQSNELLVTPDYLVDGDTLPGDMIPMPVTAPSLQMRLTFSPGQAWEWAAAVLYVTDNRIGS